MNTRMTRVLAWVSALALLAGFGSLTLVPWRVHAQPEREIVSGHATPTRQVVACAPLPGDDQLTWGVARSLGEGTPSGRLRGSEVADLSEVAPGFAAATITSSAGALVEADPIGVDPSQAGGLTFAGGSGEHFGIAAAPCRAPRPVAWFVGGDATGGRNVDLALVNPTDQAVTVTIEAWGASGAAEWARASVTVPAGSSDTVPISERMIGEDRPAWRVSATGPGIVAYAIVSGLSGQSPTGYDALPLAQTALDQTIPLGTETPGRATLRLVNPGDEAAVYAIDLIGEDGTAPLADTSRLTLAPSRVVDVDLTGAPSGTLAVRVRSTQPVVATAHLPGPETTIAGDEAPLAESLGVDASVPATDAAWAGAPLPQPAGTLLVPPGVRARVVVTAATDAEITLTPLAGDEKHHTVAAGEGRTLDLSEGLYRFTASAPVSVGSWLVRGDAVAWVAPIAAPAQAVATTVDLRP